MDEKTVNGMIDQLMNGRKYRGLDIPRETFQDLIEKELTRSHKESKVVKAVKTRLHNIVAPYLEDLNYAQTSDELRSALAGDLDTSIEELYVEVLKTHDSTRERLPYLKDFYKYIFNHVDTNCMIADLACGMNPFSLPLVETPKEMRYFAYDLHGPRVTLINELFIGENIAGKAIKADILVHPPKEHFDAVFLFKEAHRIEKRESGASRKLMQSINAEHIFISLPARSLNGKYSLRERMQKLVETIVKDFQVIEETKEFYAETIFHIRNKNG